jgi:hypothetical protein
VAPAHRRIGPVFDHPVIVGQWPPAAPRDFRHVRYQQTWMVRFDLVARLGEAAATEGAKQADKCNASSKVHSILILYGARNFLAWVNEALSAV